ncbi:MAG: hypothetical protein JWL59_586 [Chthoniobacteraceae bacterium]|nr:hypothetical protein [Chthoniobacteraceae bacterium]
MVSKISVRLSLQVIAWVIFCSDAFSAPAVKPRTALVIGNARYEPAAGPLRNSRNDASAVAKTLRSLGFAVMERHDLSRDQLLKAVDEFRKTLPGAEVALFYYAGHGISIAGSNYLIPLKSGFDSQGATDVTLRMLAETRLFNAEQAVADMSAAGAACNLVILDACRNTPLAQTGRTRDALPHGGLSEMTPPAGSLIAFATDAGQTALDGEGTNGLYTSELLKHLQTRGLTIEQVFKRTRAGVLKRSDGGQVPSEYSRLIGDDIYLAGPAEAEPAVLVQRAIAVPTLAQLNKLAESGQIDECLNELKLIASSRGPGNYAAKPLEVLLTKVKEDLKQPDISKAKLLSAVTTCEAVLELLPQCVPSNDPAGAGLAGKAHNRRGDALLLLERPEEAIKEFDAAAPLAPDDPYVLYNRGKARLALGRTDEARADFTAASAGRFSRTKAKKLAERALAEMK